MELKLVKYCHYLRVSTDKQGIDGYGIDAQRTAIAHYTPAIEFIEVESGRRKDRPELLAALTYCRKHKAILVVAKLDRLARNAGLIAAIQESGVEFICADMPEASKLTIGILSHVAADEAERIAARTKAGLAAAKARGVSLGKSMSKDKGDKGRATQAEIADRNAMKMKATLNGLVNANMSLRQIATELNIIGVQTPRGKQWTPTAVRNAIARTQRCSTITGSSI